MTIREVIQVVLDLVTQSCRREMDLQPIGWARAEHQENFNIASHIQAVFSNGDVGKVPLYSWQRFALIVRFWESSLISRMMKLNMDVKETATVLHNLTKDPKTFLISVLEIEKHTDTKEQQELGEI